MNELRTFYDLTRRTRAGVLAWLETLPPDVLTYRSKTIAHGSLVEIYAHIADTYLWWVGTVGLGDAEVEVDANDVGALRAAFARVDACVFRALETLTAWDAPFPWTSDTGKTSTLTQRWLVLHPITHEFHHKGQALAVARALGHPHPGAPDTDLVDP